VKVKKADGYPRINFHPLPIPPWDSEPNFDDLNNPKQDEPNKW